MTQNFGETLDEDLIRRFEAVREKIKGKGA